MIFLEGQEYIEELVYAIDNKYEIRIQYQPYYLDEQQTRRLLPVYLKEYKNRWYLLAYKYEENRIKTYAVYSGDVDPCIPDQADPLCEGMLVEV